MAIGRTYAERKANRARRRGKRKANRKERRRGHGRRRAIREASRKKQETMAESKKAYETREGETKEKFKKLATAQHGAYSEVRKHMSKSWGGKGGKGYTPTDYTKAMEGGPKKPGKVVRETDKGEGGSRPNPKKPKPKSEHMKGSRS